MELAGLLLRSSLGIFSGLHLKAHASPCSPYTQANLNGETHLIHYTSTVHAFVNNTVHLFSSSCHFHSCVDPHLHYCYQRYTSRCSCIHCLSYMVSSSSEVRWESGETELMTGACTAADNSSLPFKVNLRVCSKNVHI